jgi:uncharacterized membrane-anchored protein
MATGELRRARPVTGLRQASSKVPEVTALFWVTKVLTTGMGEATSDYLVYRINPVIAVGLGGIGLVICLALQYFRRQYSTWIYWLAVVMVAVFGTMVADVLHVGLGVPYVVSTTVFGVTLALIFVAWYASERTLSIHSIYTRRREAFYWATVMATFALGTAAGDMTASTMGLGFLASGVLFTVVIAVPAIAHRWLGLNAIVAFWFAYIVTRPLGASYADWLGVPAIRGGLGLGRGPVALGLTVIIVGLVWYMAATREDVAAQDPPRRPAFRPERPYPPSIPVTVASREPMPASPGSSPLWSSPSGSARHDSSPLRSSPPWSSPADYPQADYLQGDLPQGDLPQGDYPQADYPSAGYRQADYRQGDYPQPGSPAPGSVSRPPLSRRVPHLPSGPPTAPPGQPDRPSRPGRHRAPRGTR